jgi:hypothetical protein
MGSYAKKWASLAFSGKNRAVYFQIHEANQKDLVRQSRPELELINLSSLIFDYVVQFVSRLCIGGLVDIYDIWHILELCILVIRRNFTIRKFNEKII